MRNSIRFWNIGKLLLHGNDAEPKIQYYISADVSLPDNEINFMQRYERCIKLIAVFPIIFLHTKICFCIVHIYFGFDWMNVYNTNECTVAPLFTLNLRLWDSSSYLLKQNTV